MKCDYAFTMWLGVLVHVEQVQSQVGKETNHNSCCEVERAMQGRCATANGAELLPPSFIWGVGLHEGEHN